MTLASVIIALVLGALLFLWHKQERILFQPPRSVETPPESGRVSYEAVDGQQLVGFIIGDPRQAPGVLICFHGNADLAVWQLDWARSVEHRTGYAVFLAEYRGYMSLGGSPTYASTKLDARAAYDHLRVAFGVDHARVAYFGHSLVWRAISRIHFDTQQAVAELDIPVSVAHGKRDRIVPVRMGVDVYQAARNKAQFLVVEQAGHNDVADVGGEEYWQWMRNALQPSDIKSAE